MQIASAPGLLTVFFCDRPVSSFGMPWRATWTLMAPGAGSSSARGVYPPPSQFEAWFPSLAHTPEQIERTVEAAAAAFAEV